MPRAFPQKAAFGLPAEIFDVLTWNSLPSHPTLAETWISHLFFATTPPNPSDPPAGDSATSLGASAMVKTGGNTTRDRRLPERGNRRFLSSSPRQERRGSDTLRGGNASGTCAFLHRCATPLHPEPGPESDGGVVTSRWPDPGTWEEALSPRSRDERPAGAKPVRLKTPSEVFRPSPSRAVGTEEAALTLTDLKVGGGGGLETLPLLNTVGNLLDESPAAGSSSAIGGF